MVMSRIIFGGVYRHYKNNLYKVICTSMHTETGEKLVVYFKVNENPPKYYARPQNMFLENINIDGKTIKRFQFITRG